MQICPDRVNFCCENESFVVLVQFGNGYFVSEAEFVSVAVSAAAVEVEVGFEFAVGVGVGLEVEVEFGKTGDSTVG